jgi:hypothetical protein
MNEKTPVLPPFELQMEQSISMSQIQRPEQHTAVWDRHPQIQYALETVLYPTIESDPKSVKTFAVTGEAAGGKGTVIAQGKVHTEQDALLEGIIEGVHKKLARHYASTSSLVRFGIEIGLQRSEYGNPTTDEIADITEAGNGALQNAEIDLPGLRPDEVHLFLQEWAGVSERFDAGTSIVKRLGKSENALVIFVVSNPAVQERAYSLRKKLRREDVDHEQVLKKNKSKLDMTGARARTTMGTDKSIELITAIMNQDMYDSYNDGIVHLPENTPFEIRNDFERELQQTKCKEMIFNNLTRFHREKMQTHPIRPYLQEMHYRHLIKKWELRPENTQVFTLDYIEDDIYGFPQELEDIAIDWHEYYRPKNAKLMDSGKEYYIGS